MRTVALILATAAVFGACLNARALEAQERKAIILEGKEILAAGKFDEGLKFFEEYIEAYPGDTLLMVWRAKCKQLVRLKAQSEDASDPGKRVAAGRKLHLFHLHRDRVDLAESLDRKLFSEDPGAATAAMLAETLMAKKQNEEALGILTSVADPGDDLNYRIAHGLTLVRTGRVDDARKVAEGLLDEEKLDPDQARQLALLFGHTGHDAEASEILVSLFESMEVDDLEEARKEISADAEWSFAKNNAAYEAAWNAKSKNAGCGRDCATCASCFN